MSRNFFNSNERTLGKGETLKTDPMDDSFLSKDKSHGLSVVTWCYVRSVEVLCMCEVLLGGW